MARRRKAKTRVVYRTKKVRAKRRRNTSSKVKLLNTDAMIYGAFREKLSNMLTPVTSKVPFGDLADEFVMGGAMYFLAKQKGMVGRVAKTGLIIENARIGEALISGSLGGVFGGSTNNTAGQGYVYG